jgi:glycosyltransferase involved in cell wall biosynthesis
MKEDGISVLMPVYNQASFIRRAIQSLISQTYTDWELIIINDGSTDETELFIADFLFAKGLAGLGNAILPADYKDKQGLKKAPIIDNN